MKPQRALLILNPKARNGRADIAAVKARLRAGGVDLVEPGPGDAAEIIRAHAGTVDAVIVGGGDGSMNAAAPALVETGLPLGLLPLGTANDLARTLAIPFDLLAAAEVILSGARRWIDLGEVNGCLFFNVASVGFSARLARRLTGEAKARWGVLGYALGALRILSESVPFRVRIEHDGLVETVRTVQVSVGNGRFYGGGMQVAEDARPDNGRFAVYSLEVRHWAELIALAPALRAGRHGRSDRVRTLETTALTLRTRRRHDVNADGELVTRTPAVFRVRPQAVTVFAPPLADASPSPGESTEAQNA